MLSIGALAQIGPVTHRMVRHWESAALLRARRAEVADEHRLAEARLRDVERRLRLIAGFDYAVTSPAGSRTSSCPRSPPPSAGSTSAPWTPSSRAGSP